MNIKLLTPIRANNLENKNHSKNNHYSSTVMPSSQNELKADVVSFSGRIPPAVNTMEDMFRKSYDANLTNLKAIGLKFLDTISVITEKFKSRGVSLPDEKYTSQGIVKSTDSFISKLLRSGEALDKVRTTLFVENPYDFKLIRDILKELELRDYKIRTLPKRINGKKVHVPDFDIRLPGVTEAQTKVLGPELQKCIGKPQKTGYEDIQIRFVDKNAKGKKAQPIELLIVYGKNFVEAKEAESYYSYDIRRMLKNLLHINQVENPPINSPAHRVKNNIGIICDTLSNHISKPLFSNAKNKDYYHEKLEMPVELTKPTIEAITGLLEGIRTKINIHYRNEISRVSSEEFKPELEKLFKASQEYKEREDKTVYIKDILTYKNQLLKNLRTERKDDLEIILQAKRRLAETIDKYGVKDTN
ncbi:hypothetical protein HDR58_09320 [bacterium]|nr:hypothetical protein [bacterium]